MEYMKRLLLGNITNSLMFLSHLGKLKSWNSCIPSNTTMTSINNNPVPVRLCRACWTTHNVDTTGIRSIELEEWYCSNSCRQVRRFKLGLTEINSGVGRDIMRMVDRYYQHDLLNIRRNKVLERFQNNEERAIIEVISRDNESAE